MISEAEGTGKSTLYKMFLLVLGKAYCVFHDSLDTYTCRFNFPNHSKLIHWCDDISAASPKETRRLFSKVTCDVQSYEQKGEKMISMPEYHNLYITANCDAPLHTHPGDRRQLILEASELHLQDRPFFKKVNSEFRNIDIAHAWYTYLKNRDITDFHPSQDPPSSAKSKTIEACMVKSHIFMNEFFCSDEWILAYITESCAWHRWTKLYQVGYLDKGPNKGEFFIRIEHKRFFYLYKCYMRANYPSSKTRNIDTAFKELHRIGVIRHAKRKKLNDINKHVVEIIYSQFAQQMKIMYPYLEINEWDSETDQAAFIKLLKERQDKKNSLFR